MIKNLRYLCTLLLFMAVSVGWAEEVTLNLTDASIYTQTGTSGSGGNISANVGCVTVTSDKGYLDSGNHLRIYSGAKLVVSTANGTITKIVITSTAFQGSSNGPDKLKASGYTTQQSSKDGTWIGESSSVEFSATAQCRITKIVVTYTPAPSDKVATPSINGNESFYSSTEVSITCNTYGAAIQYSTNDGTTWSDYSVPFTLTETTTVQAKATKDGMTDSEVASKTFTKVTAFTNIAALTSETTAGTYYVTLNNAVVTYVNGNYAYIQDASGAVVMYKSGHGLSAGDVLNGTAEIAYQVRNGNPQITNFTGVTPVSGTAPDPTTIAASEWNTPINTVLSKYYKITGATITSSNNKYYIQLGNENVQLYGQGDASQITVADLNATYSIIGFPTIYVTNNGTTPELQIFEQPIPETTVREELTMAFVGGTLEFSDAASFVAPTLSITDESGISVDGLPITYSSSNTDVATVDASTGEVTIGSTYGTAIITASFAGNDDYVETSASYNIVYSNPNLGDYTWDLTTNSYASATADLVTWSSGYATMTLEKGTSITDANNYLGGTNNQTRLYQNQILSISPVTGYKVSSVVITAVSSYAEGFTGNSWTNATASTSGTTITVTPTDGSNTVSVVISKACRATAVKVFYEVDSTPAISVDPSSIDATCEGADGTLTVTYANVDNSSADLFFCDDNGVAATYDWIVADFDNDKNIEYLIDANTGEARTAYLKVKVGEVYSNLVTITQAMFVADYATLPFAFDGKKADIENTNGLTQHELGSDYGASPYLKFDNKDDYLILKMNEAPKALYFDIKGNSFSDGTFTVQTSEDGTTYTDLETYTELGNTQSESFNLGENVRYIKWIYTKKVNGNVALGKILVTNEIIEVTVGSSATGADGAYYSSVYYSNKALVVPANVKCQTYKMDGKLTVSKTYDAGSVVPAGQGVVIKANASGTVTFAVTTEAGEGDANSQLYGVDEAPTTPISETGYKYYKLTLNSSGQAGTAGFYWDRNSNNGTQINAAAHKVYLKVPAGSVGSKSSFVFGDETDDIRQIENGNMTMENVEIYNLAGQRVNKAQKGIYIVNGKKIVIK